MTPDELADRLLEFAASAGLLADKIPDTRLGRHIASQHVRSATSPAPNYEDARAGESKADFIHKVSICMKELRETRCWLQMLLRARLLPADSLREPLDECDQLCRIIGQSINTTRHNMMRPTRTSGPENDK